MTTSTVVNIALPEIHNAADRASRRGQLMYVRLSATRLASLFLAAVSGAVTFSIDGFDASGLVLLASFAVAALAELLLILFQPERDWYAGRALAESMKTLAWRFAVMGEPFGPSLRLEEARAILRQRVDEVTQRGRDRIDLDRGAAIATDSMVEMRGLPLSVRRAAYIAHRTDEQREWYSSKAVYNARRATAMRYFLLIGEVVALVLAALAFGRDEPFDFAGVAAAMVAGVAAWLAIKQHSQLTSAYRVAAAELAIQRDLLLTVPDSAWPQAVADAEEAISREHTMWLASRGEEPLSGK